MSQVARCSVAKARKLALCAASQPAFFPSSSTALINSMQRWLSDARSKLRIVIMRGCLVPKSPPLSMIHSANSAILKSNFASATPTAGSCAHDEASRQTPSMPNWSWTSLSPSTRNLLINTRRFSRSFSHLSTVRANPFRKATYGESHGRSDKVSHKAYPNL